MKKEKAFTMADRRSSRTHTLDFGNAFTMAEILISLTIIGVIAALTLPALMANLNEKVWNTQRKALHSRMAQALAAMPRLDGYNETDENTENYNFVLNGLTAVLNITKVCEYDKTSKCDYAYPQFTLNDEEFDTSDWGDIASFITVNGESIGVENYGKRCNGSSIADFMTSNVVNEMMCANFLYDLNGASKGPNKVGKDIGFITAFFPEYPVVVAPMPMAATTTEVSAEEVEECLEDNPDYRLPSPAEAVSLTYNGYFVGEKYGDSYIWSDNDVICSPIICDKAGVNDTPDKAYLILVSKNGDGPRTFKVLEEDDSNTGNLSCSGENPSFPGHVCTCDTNVGEWYCIDK